MTDLILSWPPRALSPNGRAHHFAKYRAKKVARQEGWAVAKKAKLSIAAGDVPVLVSMRFHPPTKTAPDADNAIASMKSQLDGIADALGVDDKTFRIAEPVFGDPVKGGMVVVTIV